MLTAILAFLQAVPAIMGGVNNFTSKYYDAKVQITTARIGGDRDVAVAMVNAAVATEVSRVEGLKVIAGSKVLLFLVVGFALPYMLYEWQCIVYDKIWMHGATRTDPLGGDLSAWATVIISCLFGSGTAVTAASMYFNRKQ